MDIELALRVIRAQGRIAGVKAIGLAYGDRRLLLRAHLLGEPSRELEARMAELRERVAASVVSAWGPEVDWELVPFAGDEAALFADQPLLIGDLAWLVEADAQRARSILALAARLDGIAPLGAAPSEAWLKVFWRDLRPSLIDPGFESVSIQDGVLTVFEGHYGWATSYSQGWITTERFSAPCTALPASPEEAARFIMAVVELATGGTAEVAEVPTSNECIYCKGTFAPLEFDSSLEACHLCAVAHCGVVY